MVPLDPSAPGAEKRSLVQSHPGLMARPLPHNPHISMYIDNIYIPTYIHTNIKSDLLETEEMAQELRALVTLAKDVGSVPKTKRKLTTIQNT